MDAKTPKTVMSRKEHKQILSIFKKLAKECQTSGTYSVAEAAMKLNLDYNKTQEWAKNDDIFCHALDWCRQGCLLNAERTLLKGEIEWEKGIRACVENMHEGMKKANTT